MRNAEIDESTEHRHEPDGARAIRGIQNLLRNEANFPLEVVVDVVVPEGECDGSRPLKLGHIGGPGESGTPPGASWTLGLGDLQQPG